MTFWKINFCLKNFLLLFFHYINESGDGIPCLIKWLPWKRVDHMKAIYFLFLVICWSRRHELSYRLSLTCWYERSWLFIEGMNCTLRWKQKNLLLNELPHLKLNLIYVLCFHLSWCVQTLISELCKNPHKITLLMLHSCIFF